MTAPASLAMVSIDCADPRELAAFYHQILGWEILHSEQDYAMIGDGSLSVGFGRLDGYTPPRWPDPGAPKQFHLDFYVADLDKAEAACLDAGAAKPDHQPGADRWRVLVDPAGHPFCICVKQEG
jgi:predicted enzyme related to lactoylglutathione lyase